MFTQISFKSILEKESGLIMWNVNLFLAYFCIGHSYLGEEWSNAALEDLKHSTSKVISVEGEGSDMLEWAQCWEQYVDAVSGLSLAAVWPQLRNQTSLVLGQSFALLALHGCRMRKIPVPSKWTVDISLGTWGMHLKATCWIFYIFKFRKKQRLWLGGQRDIINSLLKVSLTPEHTLRPAPELP